ncbi:MAG: arylsulfatase [Planctomycetota bacterium]
MDQIKPNILVILADDWGYGDVSCLNRESRIQTPYTDELAAGGMTFRDAHSNSAVCTPTRYGLLTGRYAWRSRLKQGVLFGYSRELIEDDRPTVASLLRDAGYRTACIGKWHLGLGWQNADGSLVPVEHDGHDDPGVDFTAPLRHGPHTVGFDYSLILPASLDMPPYCYIENGRVIDPPNAQCDSSERPAFWRGGAIAPGVEHETCLLEFTRRAEAFIAQHAEQSSDTPFFMYLPLPSPHTPHVPRAPFQGQSDCGTYGDYVVEHDWSIGQVLATLERNGLRDNTLVIVTSDNGAHMRGDGFDFEEAFGHRSNYIYRGQKSDVWDGGHRVPFFMSWPDRIAAGSVCDQTISLLDITATCVELAGVPLPEAAGEDSVSLVPLLDGDLDQPVREMVVTSSVTGRDAIRSDRWKLIEGPGSGGWSMPDPQVDSSMPSMQLYDMIDDPSEERNVISDHPKVVSTLLASLEQCRHGSSSSSSQD